MNIQEKTREALSTLFTDLPAPEPEADDSEEGEEKALPRADGIIEQNYNARGFHLDVQLKPEQLLEAVRIIYDLEYFLESITGVDWIKENQLEVVYDFSR